MEEGVVLIKDVNAELRFTAHLTAGLADRRDQDNIRHSVRDLPAALGDASNEQHKARRRLNGNVIEALTGQMHCRCGSRSTLGLFSEWWSWLDAEGEGVRNGPAVRPPAEGSRAKASGFAL